MSLEGRRSSAIEWPEINLDEWLDRCPENEADSTIDESDIDAIASSRSKQMEPEISKTYKFAVDRYTEIGLPHDMMNKKLSQFDDYLTECLTIIHKVVDGEYEKFVEYKESLIVKIKKMRKDLYLPTIDDNENYPLVQLCKRLRAKFNELNVVKEERMTRLQELRDKQIKHCHVLGIKTPEIKMQTDIPTREELDSLAKAVMDLAHEESKRKTKYSTLIDTISKCMDQIDYVPKDEFEANVLLAKPNYTDDYLSKLSSFHSSLEKQYATNQAKYQKLKSRLESLYDRLDVDQEVRQHFFDTHSICKPKLMAEMEAEIEEFEELKRQNIGKFIEKIKTELKIEYERCYISDETQDKFLSLASSDDCNEQLLELCENELNRMKEYYNTNKEILQKLSKWKEMWEELIDLEKKASDPNRFHNRGGQLLLEEKQRKTLQRGLPKIEKELRQMNERVKFKIFDSDLDQFIDGCWDELRNAKEVEKRERQKAKTDTNKVRKPAQQPMKTPTKRACGPGITPTPSKLQRTILGTPSNRSNLFGMSGSVKKNNISKSQQQPNSRSNIPVAKNGQVNLRDKTISNSNGSDFSGLSVSEQEFEEMIVTCPASAKRR